MAEWLLDSPNVFTQHLSLPTESKYGFRGRVWWREWGCDLPNDTILLCDYVVRCRSRETPSV